MPSVILPARPHRAPLAVSLPLALGVVCAVACAAPVEPAPSATEVSAVRDRPVPLTVSAVRIKPVPLPEPSDCTTAIAGTCSVLGTPIPTQAGTVTAP